MVCYVREYKPEFQCRKGSSNVKFGQRLCQETPFLSAERMWIQTIECTIAIVFWLSDSSTAHGVVFKTFKIKTLIVMIKVYRYQFLTCSEVFPSFVETHYENDVFPKHS